MFNEDNLLRSLSELGARADSAIFARLRAAYAQPGRHYHTQRHVAECLALFEMLRPQAKHPAEVEVALWFHDAIYDPRRGDNEARSAGWARAFLGAAGVDTAAAERVAALVLATESHEPHDCDAEIMLDVDLAILGAPAEAFDAYDQAIRREYAFVAEAEYGWRRARILRGFLDRPVIFRTRAFRARYEARARKNLARKVAELQVPPGRG